MSVLLYGSETMIWGEKERFRIRAAVGQPQRFARYKGNGLKSCAEL